MRVLPFPATDYVSLDAVKMHLRLDPLDTLEDDYLETLLTAALVHVSNHINRELYPESETPDTTTYPNAINVESGLMVAAKMLISTWYDVRETVVIGATVNKVDIAFDLLVAPYRVLQTSLLEEEETDA